MRGEAIALGPGKAELLEALASTGSIVAAARALDMSYNRAWGLVRTMNACFAGPLVESVRGGAKRGGARLTPRGTSVLRLYRRWEAKALAATAAEARALRAHLGRHA
jgi:molybdate transport system regulatory protein